MFFFNVNYFQFENDPLKPRYNKAKPLTIKNAVSNKLGMDGSQYQLSRKVENFKAKEIVPTPSATTMALRANSRPEKFRFMITHLNFWVLFELNFI
jgi:hypothetical protein